MSSIPPVPTSKNIAGRIAICGAGIGGLVLAIQLRAAGLDPVVLERRSETQLRTEGVFLTLAPNGINALRAVGLAEAVTQAGQVTRGLAMFNERGKKLGLIDRLEKRGFVRRKPDPTDRRKVMVEAAEAARQLTADVYLPLGVAGAKILEKYTVAELALVERVLGESIAIQNQAAAELLEKHKGGQQG